MYARLLLLFAAASARADDFDYALSWPGPERGCEALAAQAGARSVECALPAGRVALSFDAAGTYLEIACRDEGSFSCSELAEAAPLLGAPRAAPELASLKLSGCELPREPLACVPALLGARGAALLVLDDVRGRLRPEHVRGLEGVRKLRLYYMEGENITSVPYDVLAQLPALGSFALQKGALELEPVAGLPPLRLRALELAAGALRSLPRAAFANTPALASLGLWANRIERVDELAFEGLTQLVNLSLNSNLLRSLPPALLRPCPLLRRLDLYDNSLTELPPQLFDGLTQLETVLIFGNKGTLHLPQHLFSNLPALRHLELKTSSIQLLPEHIFQNTTNLVELNLSGNNLESIPESMFHGQSRLKVLFLSDNKLEHLQEHLFRDCGALEKLYLKGNALKSLPERGFLGTRNLLLLDLEGNQIEKIGETQLRGLAHLRELSLADNRLREIHNEAFAELARLEVLSLARNNLSISQEENTVKYIEPELYASYQIDNTSAAADAYSYVSPLRELRALARLDLSHNRVALLCADWLLLFRLRALDLRHNRLARLPRSDLAFGSSVRVDLTHNNISYFIPPPYAADPSAAPTFVLGHNPFTCDCNLFPYVDMRRRSTLPAHFDVEDAACAAPPGLRQQRLRDLRPEQLTCRAAPCPAPCRCVHRPARNRTELDCAALPQEFPQRVATRLRLRTAAELWRLPALPAHVASVDLSALNLTQAPAVARALELDLTHNHLTDIPVELLKLNCVLHLADNPLACRCGNRVELEFLKANSHLVEDYRNVTCGNGPLLSGVDPAALCTERESIVIGCSIALFGVFVAVVTGVTYRYKTVIRILLRKVGLWWGEDDTEDRRYDAFVSFAHQDERYVFETLVPKLQSGKRPLRLCLHHRDWVVGDFIPAQIARSVEQSRRTIIVLSAHFLRSVWAQMEFRAAHGRERLLVLMLEDLGAHRQLDPDLRAYIAVNTYIRADDPLVIDRLKDAVLTKRRSFVKAPKKTTARGLDVHLNREGKLVNNALAAPS